VFSRAWAHSMTMTNIMAGFHATWVCTLNHNIVKSKMLQNPAEVYDPSELPKELNSCLIQFLGWK